MLNWNAGISPRFPEKFNIKSAKLSSNGTTVLGKMRNLEESGKTTGHSWSEIVPPFCKDVLYISHRAAKVLNF